MSVPPDRLRDDIARLLHRQSGVHEFSLAAARVLRRAVPFEGVCFLTMDPATLVPTGEVVENGLPESVHARMADMEMRGEDFNTFRTLALAGRRAATLSGATGGDLNRSRRHRELRAPNGFGDELRAPLVDDHVTWGALTLLRARGLRAVHLDRGGARRLRFAAPRRGAAARAAAGERHRCRPGARPSVRRRGDRHRRLDRLRRRHRLPWLEELAGARRRFRMW